MARIIDNVQPGCPPMSFRVVEHIQCSVEREVLWDTVLERYGLGERIRVRGKYGQINDKMDFTGQLVTKGKEPR